MIRESEDSLKERVPLQKKGLTARAKMTEFLAPPKTILNKLKHLRNRPIKDMLCKISKI